MIELPRIEKSIYIRRNAADVIADPESLVTVRFVVMKGGTEVQLTHERLETATTRENHTSGWIGCLDELARVLE
jgi:hypothetical protein